MDTIAFIGGGNMASAVIGGLVAGGHDRAEIVVVEPFEAQRDMLRSRGDCWIPDRAGACAGARR